MYQQYSKYWTFTMVDLITQSLLITNISTCISVNSWTIGPLSRWTIFQLIEPLYVSLNNSNIGPFWWQTSFKARYQQCLKYWTFPMVDLITQSFHIILISISINNWIIGPFFGWTFFKRNEPLRYMHGPYPSPLDKTKSWVSTNISNVGPFSWIIFKLIETLVLKIF